MSGCKHHIQDQQDSDEEKDELLKAADALLGKMGGPDTPIRPEQEEEFLALELLVEKMSGVPHAGWAVVVDGEVFLLFVDQELAERRAAQVGGVVVEVQTTETRKTKPPSRGEAAARDK